MNKIKKIKFVNHPILGNLELNFCDSKGNVVNTVIFAGENGTGKSTILDALYKLACIKPDYEAYVEVLKEDKTFQLTYFYREVGGSTSIWVKDNAGLDTTAGHYSFKRLYNFSGVFSDVDINFHASNISSVTSLALDEKSESRRSSENLPKEINQLIIDVQALDDADISKKYRNAKATGVNTNGLDLNERMSRFTSAFSHMFDGLQYDRIDNKNGKKIIVFKKNNIDIPIDMLSSGEKQIVYRGCFLLRDTNALSGSFVFIDEPEISLHPTWQSKIMDYYKMIFTDKNGKQTSQIFVVTHSPFIIHNENRRNDKVIVVKRDEVGNICVDDKPEYYKCNSLEAVQDAFNISFFSADKSTVYLEGRTDEKYLNKALEVYEYINVPFRFKWIGYIDEKGQEANTGKDALNKAVQFLISQNLSIKNVCLFDCDTARTESDKNNVFIRVIPIIAANKKMKKGIENALILDTIDLSPYYSSQTREGDYGEKSEIGVFDKMKCSEGICKMDKDILKLVFVHIKEVIDKLIAIWNI